MAAGAMEMTSGDGRDGEKYSIQPALSTSPPTSPPPSPLSIHNPFETRIPTNQQSTPTKKRTLTFTHPIDSESESEASTDQTPNKKTKKTCSTCFDTHRTTPSTPTMPNIGTTAQAAKCKSVTNLLFSSPLLSTLNLVQQ
jgi:hypothetical protein